MANPIRKIQSLVQRWMPVTGFHFDRPLVLFQSDDWGRVGLRDQEGLEQLRAGGLNLGERPYDFYTLETAADVGALQAVLKRHHDGSGRSACLGMNFTLANVDFAKAGAGGFRSVPLKLLGEGLPSGWERPALFEAYRAGIDEGVFYPALHGLTHFCRPAVERGLSRPGERGALLRLLWAAGTPYIHWRMPWIGYEYWDPEQPVDERFLAADMQREIIGHTVGAFAKLFSTLPRSACAPGYRANRDTHRAWAQHGIRVVQNGPLPCYPPHLDGLGMLHLYRSVEFEPATDSQFDVEKCVRNAAECFQHGVPAIVSVHALNFHSSVRDFRGRTLQLLDEFLSALLTKYPDLRYLHDGDLYDLVNNGYFETPYGTTRMNVSKSSFTPARAASRQET